MANFGAAQRPARRQLLEGVGRRALLAVPALERDRRRRVVVLSALLSILAGYAFGMMRFRGDQALFYLFLLGLMVPLESTVVPLYYDLRDLGLTDTYAALILPQVGVSLAFGTFWMRAFFRSVPRSLVEAARLDGSSSWSTLWRVVLPLGRPAVLTMIVLVFMWTWNEFLLALVMVTDENLRTAPLGLAFFSGPQHDRLRAAGRRLGDRRDAGRARLRLPPAPLHPRDALRGGEGLMAGRRVRPRDQALRRRRGGARAHARGAATASSSCWSGRRAPARRPRCGCSPGSSRSPRARSASASA